MSKETKNQFHSEANILYIITLSVIIAGLFLVYRYCNQVNTINSLIFVLVVLISGLISICYIFLVAMKIKQHELEKSNKNEET